MTGRKKFNRFKVKTPEQTILARYLLAFPTKTLHFQPETLPPINALTLFGNEQPLYLDLGCGRGEFVVSQALRHPDRNFAGIDSHRKSIYACVNLAAQHGLQNVKFVHGDLRWVLDKAPDGAVSAAYLLFPAPIMKKKYRQRDMLSERFVRQFHRILEPGGRFYFVTDSADYFQAKHRLIKDLGLLEEVKTSAGIEGGITRYQQFWEKFDETSLRAEYVKAGELCGR
jgi:tRNA (guanine-N7-)-methyltransferase